MKASIIQTLQRCQFSYTVGGRTWVSVMRISWMYQQCRRQQKGTFLKCSRSLWVKSINTLWKVCGTDYDRAPTTFEIKLDWTNKGETASYASQLIFVLSTKRLWVEKVRQSSSKLSLSIVTSINCNVFGGGECRAWWWNFSIQKWDG